MVAELMNDRQSVRQTCVFFLSWAYHLGQLNGADKSNVSVCKSIHLLRHYEYFVGRLKPICWEHDEWTLEEARSKGTELMHRLELVCKGGIWPSDL